MKPTDKEIEFCYHLENRWPIRCNAKHLLKPIVETAINETLDILEDEYHDEESRVCETGTLGKFTKNEQALILKRLRLAIFEGGNAHDDEDFILEEMLYHVINDWVEVICDMKKDRFPIATKQWKMLKAFYCESIREDKPIKASSVKDSDVIYYMKECIWHDLDWEMWDLKASHIKEYKKILKAY